MDYQISKASDTKINVTRQEDISKYINRKKVIDLQIAQLDAQKANLLVELAEVNAILGEATKAGIEVK